MPASTDPAVWKGASGWPASQACGSWPEGDNGQLVSGGRVAVPAVGGVEQVTADHRHLDGVPEGPDVIGGSLRDMERSAAGPGGHLGIFVAVPVEQRPDRVIGIGDVAVHRHDRLHDNLGPLRSSAGRRNDYMRRSDEDIQLARRSMVWVKPGCQAGRCGTGGSGCAGLLARIARSAAASGIEVTPAHRARRVHSSSQLASWTASGGRVSPAWRRLSSVTALVLLDRPHVPVEILDEAVA
jgi:hypothetical protein